MCICAVHCPESPYHEKACCDLIWCECWCHDEGKNEKTGTFVQANAGICRALSSREILLLLTKEFTERAHE